MPTLPSSCSPHPTPPYPRICALELTDQKTREKKQGTQRAGWGGRTFWAGGVCVGAPEESRAEGSASGSSLPGAAGAALDCCALVVEHAGRGGAGQEHPARPLPGRHESLARPPPPANSGPSHGDQSERGWLGGKPREAFISARVAAGSCLDRLPVLQLNGLAYPSPGGTPLCGGSPACPAISEEIKWSRGGHREVSRSSPPVLAHSRLRGLGTSFQPLPRARAHTHAHRHTRARAKASRLGLSASPGRAQRLGAATRVR